MRSLGDRGHVVPIPTYKDLVLTSVFNSYIILVHFGKFDTRGCAELVQAVVDRRLSRHKLGGVS